MIEESRGNKTKSDAIINADASKSKTDATRSKSDAIIKADAETIFSWISNDLGFKTQSFSGSAMTVESTNYFITTKVLWTREVITISINQRPEYLCQGFRQNNQYNHQRPPGTGREIYKNQSTGIENQIRITLSRIPIKL